MHRTPYSSARARAVIGVLGAVLLVSGGCADIPRARALAPRAEAPAPAFPDLYASPSEAPAANAVRTGRYQLVSLAPTSGQRNLLHQAVSIDLPQSMQLSVRDGLKHVLRGSGLRLCQAQAGFFSSPLPAVHRTLGPMTLSDALQVLAGPAWRLRADFLGRTVCFDRRARTASYSTRDGQ